MRARNSSGPGMEAGSDAGVTVFPAGAASRPRISLGNRTGEGAPTGGFGSIRSVCVVSAGVTSPPRFRSDRRAGDGTSTAGFGSTRSACVVCAGAAPPPRFGSDNRGGDGAPTGALFSAISPTRRVMAGIGGPPASGGVTFASRATCRPTEMAMNSGSRRGADGRPVCHSFSAAPISEGRAHGQVPRPFGERVVEVGIG